MANEQAHVWNWLISRAVFTIVQQCGVDVVCSAFVTPAIALL